MAVSFLPEAELTSRGTESSQFDSLFVKMTFALFVSAILTGILSQNDVFFVASDRVHIVTKNIYLLNILIFQVLLRTPPEPGQTGTTLATILKCNAKKVTRTRTFEEVNQDGDHEVETMGRPGRYSG
jgi:hypothetical protein